MNMIFETERLFARKLTKDDFGSLCRILQDPEVMYAYEHAFSDAEVNSWLERQLKRYVTDGFGLWAVILKETGSMIGQCGLTWQDRGDGTQCVEVGYLLQRAFWHQGYATEAATACKAYAFQELGLDEVCSIIRDTNTASQRVAQRIGMEPRFTLVKHYYGMDMPHLVFSVRRDG